MKKFLWILPVVILIAAGCSVQKFAQQPVSAVTPAQFENPNTAPTVAPTETPAQSSDGPGYYDSSGYYIDESSNTIFPDYVPQSLIALKNVELFKGTDDAPTDQTQFEYFQVSGIKVGGGDLILAVDGDCGGVGCQPAYFRFLKSGSTYTLLTKYSAPLDGSIGISKGDLVILSTSGIDVPALDMPTQLQDPKTGSVVNLDTQSSESLVVGNFFNPQGMSLMFTADGYGVYSESSDDEEFYVQAPDGKELAYYLMSEFLGQDQNGSISRNVAIQWNKGIVHATDYTFDLFSACDESQGYVDAIKNNPISQADLMPVGTDEDSGEPVYAIKDTSNPILVAVQAEDKSSGETGNEPAQYEVIYWKDPFGRLVRLVDFGTNGCGGKPVIYLYPTKPMNVSVHVAPAGSMSASDPAYGNGWNVFAQPNGTLTDNGEQYPYLFWEGGLGTYKIPTDGFVVQKQGVKQLLDSKLSLIGLDSKEISDFEQFWLPRMQKSSYYFVTFTTNSEMDTYAPLSIDPKPDTVIRVLMDYEPLQNYEAVVPLNLQPTQRKGFTVVEWGGVLK